MKILLYESILAKLQFTPLANNSNFWIFYWLLLLSSIIITAKLFSPKRFSQSLLGLISSSSYKALTSEGIVNNIINILLAIQYVLAFGLLLTTLSQHYYPQAKFSTSGFMTTLTFSSLIILFIILKIGFILITQWIYQAKKIAFKYLNYLMLSYDIMGLVIFFGLWLLLYVNFKVGIISILTLMVILFIVRLLKITIIVESKNNFSLFSFIVYLCTVEILPLIIVQKLYLYWVAGG